MEKPTQKTITDFDGSIIGYQVDHSSLGENGAIFASAADAKQKMCDILNNELGYEHD